MSQDQMKLVLNSFCVLFKQEIKSLDAVWARTERTDIFVNSFGVKVCRRDYALLHTIDDVRESKPLRWAASCLASEVIKYAKGFIEIPGDIPVLLCGDLILPATDDTLRRRTEPGFSIRLWFDGSHAHFDMVLRGTRL